MEFITDRIPRRYEEATFENPELLERVRPPVAVAEARGIREPLVLITGPTGTGKTTLAVAMVRETPGARYMRGLWDFRYLRPSERGSVREQSLSAPALLVDGLGNESEPSQGDPREADGGYDVGAFLEVVLGSRRARGLRTVVTTYRDRAEIERRYGLSIARWLFDGARRIDLDPSYDCLAAIEGWTLPKKRG